MVNIVSFQPHHWEAFKVLNEEWILMYFELEESDQKMLNDPKGYILDKGGAILMAEEDGDPVGTCALIKRDDTTFELAKMAVSPKAQGRKIGLRLGESVLSKAKEMGALKVVLETNSKLKPAISLYRKLGFTDIEGMDSPYSRCNLQMEVSFTSDS